MTRRPNEGPDLKLVEELLFAPCRLDLHRFTHAETVAGRTPDFRVTRDGQLVAYCEVKSPRDDWLDNLLSSAPPGQIVGGGRNDPTFNRVARHIEKAATQFDAVNSARAVPNILVFVNHADTGHYGDLVETVTGLFHAASGERYVTMAHISEGRLAAPKYRIDLYVWFDVRSRRVQGYLFNEAFPDNVRRVCELFGLTAPERKSEPPITATVADCEAALERAYRVLEVARRDNVPLEEMMIYHRRVAACRDALEEARRPRAYPCADVVIVE